MSDQFVSAADYADQIAFFDPDTFNETVTIIGCGGIGASLLPTLVTMGVKKITLFDDDTVESRNVASQQLYRPADIGRPKVERCAEYIQEYNPTSEVIAYQHRFTAHDIVEPTVLISAVDSMTERQNIWRAVQDTTKPNRFSIGLMLDGRIGGEHMSLFALDPLNAGWYENDWLFDDKHASPLPCAGRAIAYTAVALGAFICSHLAHWHTSGELPPNLIELNMGKNPFFEKVRCQPS